MKGNESIHQNASNLNNKTGRKNNPKFYATQKTITGKIVFALDIFRIKNKIQSTKDFAICITEVRGPRLVNYSSRNLTRTDCEIASRTENLNSSLQL